jgi:hypothetical protein
VCHLGRNFISLFCLLNTVVDKNQLRKWRYWDWAFSYVESSFLLVCLSFLSAFIMWCWILIQTSNGFPKSISLKANHATNHQNISLLPTSLIDNKMRINHLVLNLYPLVEVGQLSFSIIVFLTFRIEKVKTWILLRNVVVGNIRWFYESALYTPR